MFYLIILITGVLKLYLSRKAGVLIPKNRHTVAYKARANALKPVTIKKQCVFNPEGMLLP